MTTARDAAERAARDGYGRLVAFLSLRTGDLASAEDALSDALVAALERWPESGVPDAPEAWLLAVATRRSIDAKRHREAKNLPLDLLELASAAAETDRTFPDDRLKLLFVCAHPAIDPAAQTPLMLQTVLGFDAATIARAFLVSASTMGQRLVRAKTRIRELAVPFQVPEPGELPERLDAVLNAIYAIYGRAWDDAADERSPGWIREAIHLARMLGTLLPNEPEPLGLLALMLHCEARRPARSDGEGRYIPLGNQDAKLWKRAELVEAEQHLGRAATYRRTGRFQLEAAIQSAHNRRAYDGTVPWDHILALYRELIRQRETIGARVAYAGALASAGFPQSCLDELESMPIETIASYQPYWAVRSFTLEALGRSDAARTARDRAAALSNDEAVRRFLDTPPRN